MENEHLLLEQSFNHYDFDDLGFEQCLWIAMFGRRRTAGGLVRGVQTAQVVRCQGDQFQH